MLGICTGSPHRVLSFGPSPHPLTDTQNQVACGDTQRFGEMLVMEHSTHPASELHPQLCRDLLDFAIWKHVGVLLLHLEP
jgi:hypothetical protein